MWVGHMRRANLINWTRIIWQTDTDEPLQRPADSKRRGAGAGYQPFSEILPKFQTADVLSSHVDPTEALRNAVCAQC